MGWCPNPGDEFLRFFRLLYNLLWVYIILGFVFAFLISLKCFRLEKWFFRYPLMIVCTSFNYFYLLYYFFSLNNKNVCSDDHIQ